MQAVIFDLDGVVTRTAGLHAQAWKLLFDEYLAARARRLGEAFRPFDPESDYQGFVDGKPRYDGVASFLASRGIALPFGSPDDPDERETVCGLGNRKNRYFVEQLARHGVEVFDDAVTLLHAARRWGARTAVVSASENCHEILRRAGLLELFDARVTGVEAAALGLAGKPAPDTYLKAAQLLGVAPSAAVVLEDAISGVTAGRAGGFGLVVGVDRGSGAALREHGADVVVGDLTQLLPAGHLLPPAAS
jgi:alpha,alpha-trehalase